jgi:hypothetical protein
VGDTANSLEDYLTYDDMEAPIKASGAWQSTKATMGREVAARNERYRTSAGGIPGAPHHMLGVFSFGIEPRCYSGETGRFTTGVIFNSFP